MPRVQKIFLIFSLLAKLFYCDEEEIDLDQKDIKIDAKAFEQLPGTKLNTNAQLEKIQSESDITFLQFFYSKSSKNSYMSIHFVETVATKLMYLAEILTVDCDETTEFDFCNVSKDPQSFPRMKALVPPQYKINPYTKQVSKYLEYNYSENTVSENSIYNFVSKHIQNKGIKLNFENHKTIISNPNFNKVLLFTDKAQTGLIFKGLSGYFHDRIVFCEVHNSEQDLVLKYGVKKYPTLFIVETLETDLETQRQTPEIHEYRGNLKAKDIAEFITKFSHNTKLYLSNQKKQSSDEFNKEKIVQSLIKKLSGENLVADFEKLKEKRVALHISSVDDVEEGLVNFARKANGFYSFIRVNCGDKENSIFCSKFKNPTLSTLYIMEELGLTLNSRIAGAYEITNLSYSNIVSEIRNEFQSEIVGLTKETFHSLTYSTLNVDKKIPAIYLFNTGDVDIVLHLMSRDLAFSKYVTFYGYSNPPIAQAGELGVKDFPNLVFLFKDNLNGEK